MFIGGFMAATLAISTPQTVHRPSPDESPSAHQGESARANAGKRTYASVYIKERISEGEFKRYSQFMGLHPAQESLFARCYQEYLERDTAIRNECLSSLMEQAAHVATLRIYEDMSAANEYGAFMKQRDRCANLLAANDARLFDEIRPILADIQVANLERAINHRVRARATMFPYEYPGSRVDLTDLLYELERSPGFVPLDRTLMQTLLTDYETRLTSLMKQYIQSRVVAMVLAIDQWSQIEQLVADFDSGALAHRSRELGIDFTP